VTIEAIEKLEGLQVMYQRNQTAMVVHPHELHAVFTFEISAHCGVSVWDYEWWTKRARRCTEWELEWARDWMHHEHTRGDAMELLGNLRHAMGRWEELGKLLTKKKVNDPEYKQWIRKISRAVEDLWKDLDESQ
jgi:hypothetical protein